MSDLIDRQAAIDAFERFIHELGIDDEPYNYGEMALSKDNVPPAQPEQPQRTGRWIFDENDYLTKCSECGCHPWFGVIPTVKEATKKLPHCPMCLVKMEGNDR